MRAVWEGGWGEASKARPPIPRTPPKPPPCSRPSHHKGDGVQQTVAAAVRFASLTYKPSLSACSPEARLMKGAMGGRGREGGRGRRGVLIWKMSPQRSARCVVSCFLVLFSGDANAGGAAGESTLQLRAPEKH